MVKVRVINKPNDNIQSLSSNGTVFSNGLEFVNAGGSHESNPYQGIQVSNDDSGNPNLVEEGEVIWNDEYVFSNRLKVPKAFKEKFKIGNVNKDESYADLVRLLQSKKDELTNDPIAQRTLNANLTRLQESQEEERAKKEARDFKREMNKLSPQEQQNILYQMTASQQQPMVLQAPVSVGMDTPGEVVNDMPQSSMQQAQSAQQIPSEMNGLQGYAYGGNMFDGGGRLPNNAPYLKDLSLEDIVKQISRNGQIQDYSHLSYAPYMTPSPALQGNGDNKYRSRKWKDFLSASTDNGITNYEFLRRSGIFGDNTKDFNELNDVDIEALRNAYLDTKYGAISNVLNDPKRQGEAWHVAKGWYDNAPERYRKAFKAANKNVDLTTAEGQNALIDYYKSKALLDDRNRYTKEYEDANNEGFFDIAHYLNFVNHTNPVKEDVPGSDNGGGKIFTPPTIPEREKSFITTGKKTVDPLPTWMRYAPIWGSAFATAMSSAKPDYSRAEEIQRAYNYGPSLIQPRPIGDYMQYKPMDINYQANQLASQSAATRNAIMQQSSGNRGSAMAGLVALDNNANIQLGGLNRNALEYNDNLRRTVSDFNRGTNQYNSQNNMQAQMANQGALNQAKMANAHGTQIANTMKEQIDAQRAAAISQNLTGLFNNIGNLGRENFAFNQINSNNAYNYGYKSKNGKTSYLVGLAYGGYLNK